MQCITYWQVFAKIFEYEVDILYIVWKMWYLFEGELNIKEQLINLILEYYEGHGWKYTELLGENPIIEVLRPTWSMAEVRVSAVVSGTAVTVYTAYPTAVSQDRYAELLELMAEINHIELLGNLELDMQTGRLRYKSHTLWGRYTMPNRQVLSRYLNAGIRIFDKYYISLLGVIEGRLSVSEALKMTDE